MRQHRRLPPRSVRPRKERGTPGIGLVRTSQCKREVVTGQTPMIMRCWGHLHFRGASMRSATAGRFGRIARRRWARFCRDSSTLCTAGPSSASASSSKCGPLPCPGTFSPARGSAPFTAACSRFTWTGRQRCMRWTVCSRLVWRSSCAAPAARWCCGAFAWLLMRRCLRPSRGLHEPPIGATVREGGRTGAFPPLVVRKMLPILLVPLIAAPSLRHPPERT